MGIRDVLKKKNDLQDTSTPQFVLSRSDTVVQEDLQPADHEHLATTQDHQPASKTRRSLDVFRPRSRSRSASASSQTSNDHRRLSQRLHLSREASSSEYVPQDLPEIMAGGDPADESQWEKRATILAGQTERARSSSRAASPAGGRPRSHSREVSSQQIDQDIQEAIRLHEEGDLEQSTRLFGRLADPKGAANPLSQVLYGLALRHGWGCQPDPEGAVYYLTAAASNAASVEQLALQAGLKKGGAAKGELVLAIFELANCFRHGWGIEKDPVAAKQYYETAANLGDSDAMNEVAWCYLEGYGCKKDKFTSARYYRLAEKAGNKTIGNSWIWKEKYDPPGEKGK